MSLPMFSVAARRRPALLLAVTALAALLLVPTASFGQSTAAPTAVKARPLAEIVTPTIGRAAATVVSLNDSLISSELVAPVAVIHADVGATVSKGDLLVELAAADQRLLLAQSEAAHASAQARLALAQQRLARGVTLGDKSYISSDELLALKTSEQAARADLAAAEAQRAIAARAVAKTRIIAPFDAVVMERHAQVGAMTGVGTALIRLVAVDGAEIEARLSDADARSLERASELSFEHAGRRLPLQLLRLSSVIDSSSRTRVARLGFVDQTAPPGSSGSISWRGESGQIPASLIVDRDGQLGLFVNDGGMARFVSLPDAQAGRPAGAGGLADGLRVVVEGQQGLGEGDALIERER